MCQFKRPMPVISSREFVVIQPTTLKMLPWSSPGAWQTDGAQGHRRGRPGKNFRWSS